MPSQPSQPPLLHDLIERHGHEVGPRIEEFAELATAVQRWRRKAGVSDSSSITRSTALWTLMEQDEPIRNALERSGISQTELRQALSLRSVPAPDRGTSARLHEDFARALEAYLDDEPLRAIDLPDLAVALLRGAREGSSGLLPGRLDALHADTGAALAALERLVVTNGRAAIAVDDGEFSATVRELRRELGPATRHTAGRVAESLQARHPRYVGGRFGRVGLRPRVGETAATDDWLRRVRELYDLAEVAESRHKLIDGQLTLLGLAELDATLSEDLTADGFLSALREEAAVRPRRDASSATRTAERVTVRTRYLSDAVTVDVELRDEIGVEADVDALARLIVDERVTPPLSIGLFGDWGSGKSYFMRLLQQRVDELTASGASGAGRQPAYVGVVRQIEFNAWHYADDNLWASLLERLFQQLGKPEELSQIAQELQDGGNDPQGGILNYVNDRRRRANATLSEGQREEQDAKERLAALEPAGENKGALLRALASADLAGDPALASAKAQIAADFGRDAVKGAQAASTTTNLLVRVAGDLQVLWSLVRDGRGRRRRRALAGGAVALLAIVGLIVLAATQQAWLLSLSSTLVPIGFVIGVLARGASAAVNREALTATGQAAAQAEADQAAAEEKIAAAAAELAALETGRATEDYLVARAAEFRSRQGQVALVREELEQLGNALESAEGGAQRVILYIDDLDRCGTRRVVQVLEAVHLLLAFPLFVVVVGVDARWLLNSLSDHYRAQFSGKLAAATPQQYLEKIFQIPFAIRPLDRDGFERLMRSMLGSEPSGSASRAATGDASSATAGDELPAADPSRQAGAPPEHRPTGAGSPTPQRESQADVIEDAPPITSEESSFAATLQPIVRSPRAAKRLVNLYRIVRATAMGTGRGATAEREYRQILVLLALLVGAPDDAIELFAAARGDETIERMAQLIARVPDPDTRSALVALARLIETHPDLDPLAPYRDWMPSVARFSFDVAVAA